MISLKELLDGHEASSMKVDHMNSLVTLQERVNKLRDAYGKPMKVTSGYRSKSDQIRIYKAKGITDESKIPMGSAHLSGQAVDFADPTGELQKFIKDNVPLMESIGLWFEDFGSTKGWVHAQSRPAKQRFFKP